MPKFNYISKFFSYLQTRIPDLEIPHSDETSGLKFYNTLNRKKEIFKPTGKGRVGIYTCGPTVYGYPHLGNMRTYIFEDILKRVFIYNGYRVKHVMNVTDVGHLTGDRDMGEDKMEREAKKTKKTAWEIAKFYTEAFKKDLGYLNISPADILCKATDHIPEQIAMIQELERKGYTYRTSDGIYFDTSKVEDYTKLSHQNLEQLKEGARVEKNDEKINITDFALWKFSPHASSKEEKRQMEWTSPWGVGFPGWHIECSAMSMRYLGEHIDVHCGATDHISIHHTNEIAQSEASTGKKPWVNYWIHGEFLNLPGGRKMSKSAGDIVTVENTFVDKHLNPLIYRFATLNTHYRKTMEWSDDILITAQNSYDNFIRRVKALGTKVGKINSDYKNEFNSAINDDLNMPQALAVANEVFKSDISEEDKLATILDFDKVFGLELEKSAKEKTPTVKIPENINKLMAERQAARQAKDWAASDKIRDELKDLGWEVKDTPVGQKINKI